MENQLVCILDYGSGNVKSVLNSLLRLGYLAEISNNPSVIRNATHLVLPGVGSFEKSMNKIKDKLPLEILFGEIQLGKPFLGICVGMQVFATHGTEYGNWKGLNLIENSLVDEIKTELSKPHIGWNNIKIRNKHPILHNIDDDSDFYFLHSYAFTRIDRNLVIATCDYGSEFPAVVAYKNIVGTQFHPEKSQKKGLQVLKNFMDWQP
jgi:glutamine amidotransferase